jgi:colanic acid biosynthesis glycosyl transferase WcaI
MQEYLMSHYDMSREQIEVIPNWSDPDQIFPKDRSSRFRSEHGLDGFVVLYAGNFGRHQDFDSLLDAAKSLSLRQEKVLLVLVGDGAKREHIAHRVRAENISNVRMFPFVPRSEFNDLLASADVSLVTLEAGAEGLGVPSKFYNILASGRPTVAVTGPSSEVARVVAEARCGVRVEQGDAAGLADVLCTLAHSPIFVQRMGENARKLFLESYTLDKIARRYVATVESVLSAGGVRAEAQGQPVQGARF